MELEGGTLTSSAGDLVSLLVRLPVGAVGNAVAGGGRSVEKRRPVVRPAGAVLG